MAITRYCRITPLWLFVRERKGANDNKTYKYLLQNVPAMIVLSQIEVISHT